MPSDAPTELTAVALNCTLKRSGDPSSTDKLLGELLAALARHGVSGEVVHVVDLDIKPGVSSGGIGMEYLAVLQILLAT